MTFFPSIRSATKHSLHLVLLQPHCHILELIVVHNSKCGSRRSRGCCKVVLGVFLFVLGGVGMVLIYAVQGWLGERSVIVLGGSVSF